jgi:predicted transcriptional regulator
MMSAAQLRAARALLGMDQKSLAELAGISLPTVQRMEASEGIVRGNIDTLSKVIEALSQAGVELIGDNARSERGGRGVRLREPPLRAEK